MSIYHNICHHIRPGKLIMNYINLNDNNKLSITQHMSTNLQCIAKNNKIKRKIKVINVIVSPGIILLRCETVASRLLRINRDLSSLNFEFETYARS